MKLPVAEEPLGSGKTDAGALLLGSFGLARAAAVSISTSVSSRWGSLHPDGYLLQAAVRRCRAIVAESRRALHRRGLRLAGERAGRDSVSLDLGAIWRPTRNIALDASVVTSLTGSGPDWARARGRERPLRPVTRAACLMVQGTASRVGKSLLVAALCRLFARARLCGWRRSRPRTCRTTPPSRADGGEIGRAQAAQAEAAGVEPTVDMNPILLKPEARRPLAGRRARPRAWPRQLRASTAAQADELSAGRRRSARPPARRATTLVIIEGAGSPAEINLRDARHRQHARGPARRGAGAAGRRHRPRRRVRRAASARWRCSSRRRARAGARPGRQQVPRRPDAARARRCSMLEERTGVPVLGRRAVIDEPRVPEEDALDLDERPDAGDGRRRSTSPSSGCRASPTSTTSSRWPPSRACACAVCDAPAELADADLVVLPGSKSTVADLRLAARARAWPTRSRRWRAPGAPVLGVCGGYQMLGRALRDPDGVESRDARVRRARPAAGRRPRSRPTKTDGAGAGPRARSAGPFAARGVDAYEIHAGVARLREGVAQPVRDRRARGRRRGAGGARTRPATSSGPTCTGSSPAAPRSIRCWPAAGRAGSSRWICAGARLARAWSAGIASPTSWPAPSTSRRSARSSAWARSSLGVGRAPLPPLSRSWPW